MRMDRSSNALSAGKEKAEEKIIDQGFQKVNYAKQRTGNSDKKNYISTHDIKNEKKNP